MVIRTVEGIFRKEGKSRATEFLHDYVHDRVHLGMTIDRIVYELDSWGLSNYAIDTYNRIYWEPRSYWRDFPKSPPVEFATR